ncbi:MAG: site-specific DNA-methyltransferase [Proteobacteria bacterium]|nr:MAG: site-specific DNA-methyltransferase [Pseudomonadota bacterium]
MYETASATKLSTPYYQSDDNGFRLHQGDCREVLAELPAESVDLIFADPPYFLSNGGVTCQSGKMVSVHKGKWDVSQGVEENHAFNHSWLAACKRVLKPNGSIFVSGTRHVIYSVGFAMQQLGFKILNDIAWYKVTPPPNLSCRYFTHATETILWAGRDGKTKHFFAYADMKEENGGKQMQSLWSLRPPLKAEKRFGKHPTQKPLALLERIIRAASEPGALVVDPFSGSGTTGVASARLGRNYLGIEMEPEYLQLAINRYEDLHGEVAATRPKRSRRGPAKAHGYAGCHEKRR